MAATLLSYKTFSAVIATPNHGNVEWNDDGQCLVLSSKAVHIFTPYICSTLAPPPGFTRSNQADTLNGNEPGPSSRPRARRPKDGEVRWWANGVEDNNQGRDPALDPNGQGNEYEATIKPMEPEMRSACWSPSGLSDMGGCLLATMNTRGQVSVYAPNADPYTKPWAQIDDLTIRATGLMRDGSESSSMAVNEIKQLQSVCMGWSSCPVLSGRVCRNGSLLAITSRSGHLDLWSYGSDRSFRRVSHIKVFEGLIVRLAWSEWRQISDTTCESTLAIALSDGRLCSHVVHQSKAATVADPSRDWSIEVSTLDEIDAGDGRGITAVAWLKGLLVWAKPGSVHLWSGGKDERTSWHGTHSVVLGQMGNWAGATPYTDCIGLHWLDPDGLLVVTSSLSVQTIRSVFTSPALVAPDDCLRPSVIMRDLALDVIREPKPASDWMIGGEERMITTHTTGFQAVGAGADIFTFASEPINFYNLDVVTDGSRQVNLCLADLGAVLPKGRPSMVDHLYALLDQPSSLLQQSSLKALLPFMLHALASVDPATAYHDIFDVLTAQGSSAAAPADDIPLRGLAELYAALWQDSSLDNLRLRYVLSMWCKDRWSETSNDFEALAQQHLSTIRTAIASVIDRSELSVTADEAEQCPACGETVEKGGVGVLPDSVRCSRGHEWSRCCVSGRIIVQPLYRVCTVCPAVSLIPQRGQQIPQTRIVADDAGQSSTASQPDIAAERLHGLLDAAVSCVICGGRWARSM